MYNRKQLTVGGEMAEEDDFFAQAMQDVAPIKAKHKAELGKPQRRDPGLAERRRAAVTIADVDKNFLSADYAPSVAPQDLVNFHRSGVQYGVLKKLRLGQYPLEATLDLHRRNVEQSRVELFEFIRDCVKYGLRTVLITHGRGDRNGDGKAVLKSYCSHWLPQIAEVLAFHTAQPQHGSYGAMYVLLKKGEKARNENRERHGQRARQD